MGDKNKKGGRRAKSSNTDAKSNMAGTPKQNVAKCAINAKEEVERWCKRCLDIGVDGLRNEYGEKLKRYVPADMTFNAFKEHHPAGRNRYQDVPCQDKGRVVLRPPAPIDYIHANYVMTPMSEKRFICTQGPLDCTIIDFWYMIIQEETDSILMLCNVIEKGMLKCAQYWPNELNETKKISDTIEVINTEVRPLTPEETSIRLCVLKLKWKEGAEAKEREVRHYQWQDWPDRGVPVIKGHTPTELLSRCRGTKKPIVVHCSAGIGRTGTIVAIEYTLERLMMGLETVDMDKLLKEVRDQRPYTIQNDVQYLYIHRALLHYFFVKYKHASLQTDAIQGKYKKFIADYDKATA